MADYDLELDARGLNCPLPILRTKKSLKELNSGQVLQMMSTDPGSVKDIEAFCQQAGHTLLDSKESEGTYIFDIRKG